MPDLQKPALPEKDRFCGNCRFCQLVLPDEFKYPWSKGWVCKNLEVNPNRKNPRNGKMHYFRKSCKKWEW